MTLPKGDTTQRGRGRGVFFSGNDNTTPAADAIKNNIDFIQIQSMENSFLLVIQLIQREEGIKQQHLHQQEV